MAIGSLMRSLSIWGCGWCEGPGGIKPCTMSSRRLWRERAKSREECLVNLREAITLTLEYRREAAIN
jgi:hypothetical protein